MKKVAYAIYRKELNTRPIVFLSSLQKCVEYLESCFIEEGGREWKGWYFPNPLRYEKKWTDEKPNRNNILKYYWVFAGKAYSVEKIFIE